MEPLLVWLTLFHRFQDSGGAGDFRKWLKNQPNKFDVEEDEACVFSDDIRRILHWKTCPDHAKIQATLQTWQDQKDNNFLKSSTLLQQKNTRTAFRDTDTKGFTISVLDSKTIPADLLWYLQNEFQDLLDCGLMCSSGSLLFILWHNNSVEGWAVVDEVQDKKGSTAIAPRIDLECLCARRDRTHSFKVGSYLVHFIRDFVAPKPVHLNATMEALGFYLKLGFRPNLDLMAEKHPPEWDKTQARIKTALSTGNINKVIAELQTLKRIFPTIPMQTR